MIEGVEFSLFTNVLIMSRFEQICDKIIIAFRKN